MTSTDNFPLSQRLSLLKDIMRRDDITATAKTLCWLLLAERMNSTTGRCECSNTHIAKQLGTSLASVKRAKLELRKAQVLETSTPAQSEPTKKNEISSFVFLRRFVAQIEPSNAQIRAKLNPSPAHSEPTKPTYQKPTQQAHSEPTRKRPKHGERIGDKIYAGCIRGAESAELTRADLDHVRTTGRSLPRDKHGGWLIDARYFETLQ